MSKEEILDKMFPPEDQRGEFWYPSHQVDGEYQNYGSLAALLFPKVRWFFDEQEGSYQGDWFMIGRNEDTFYFFSMGYGSCSGCDWLQGCDTREEMEKLLEDILATPTFSKENILKHVKKFDWPYYYDEEAHNELALKAIKAVEKELSLTSTNTA